MLFVASEDQSDCFFSRFTILHCTIANRVLLNCTYYILALVSTIALNAELISYAASVRAWLRFRFYSSAAQTVYGFLFLSALLVIYFVELFVANVPVNKMRVPLIIEMLDMHQLCRIKVCQCFSVLVSFLCDRILRLCDSSHSGHRLLRFRLPFAHRYCHFTVYFLFTLLVALDCKCSLLRSTANFYKVVTEILRKLEKPSIVLLCSRHLYLLSSFVSDCYFRAINGSTLIAI